MTYIQVRKTMFISEINEKPNNVNLKRIQTPENSKERPQVTRYAVVRSHGEGQL